MKKLILILYACFAVLACAAMAASTATGYKLFNTGSVVSKDKASRSHGPGSHVVIFHK